MYLTLSMFDAAKKNGGYVDQDKFKTSDTYVFDSLVLTESVISIVDVYVRTVRPQMKPKCDYILVNTAGNQFTALGAAMSLLVHDAIGKFVNPTRYRQIVETESSIRLTREEGEIITRDQKHSSQVRTNFKRVEDRNAVVLIATINSHHVGLSKYYPNLSVCRWSKSQKF
jgi:hypothetical protein